MSSGIVLSASVVRTSCLSSPNVGWVYSNGYSTSNWESESNQPSWHHGREAFSVTEMICRDGVAIGIGHGGVAGRAPNDTLL